MSSWLTSALQTVRDKSADALEFVRKDLTEFTTTVKSDTETYLNKIKTQEVGDLGINHFVSKLSNSIKTNNTDEQHFQAQTSFDRVHTELTRLQNDESTYLIDPIPIDAYENWRQTTDFNVDTRKGEIAQLLIDAPHVRSFYAHLVPAQTTHSDFWSRYYYRVHQIEEEEARRTQLLKRAHEICSETTENTEINSKNDWEESDEEWSEQQPPPQLTTTTISNEDLTSKPTIPIEEHQEVVTIDTDTEKPSSERTDSGTVSGDSWEREFDETSPPPIDPLIKSEETITNTESVTSSTIEEKKGPNEFDDEWESCAPQAHPIFLLKPIQYPTPKTVIRPILSSNVNLSPTPRPPVIRRLLRPGGIRPLNNQHILKQIDPIPVQKRTPSLSTLSTISSCRSSSTNISDYEKNSKKIKCCPCFQRKKQDSQRISQRSISNHFNLKLKTRTLCIIVTVLFSFFLIVIILLIVLIAVRR